MKNAILSSDGAGNYWFTDPVVMFSVDENGNAIVSGNGVDVSLTASGDMVIVVSDSGVMVFVTDRTHSDVLLKNEKGTYNYTDLNRVGWNVRKISETMRRHGYLIDNSKMRVDWMENELLYSSALEDYISGILVLDRVRYGPAVHLPFSAERLTYEGANNIEIFLESLNGALGRSEEVYVYSGEVVSGG